MTLAPGTKLDPYEIVAPIGSGGMDEVWKARDTRLGRMVAIKTVKEQHSERFKQEARSIAALNHQYICQLHDIGPDYLVLEYVEGKPLSSPLPEKDAVRLAIQITTALGAAHKKGIIHRDLKPANIMVTDEGSVKLLDFGLAKLYEQDASISTSPTADFPATQAGAVLGTVAYMSPEQAQGQLADARSDIFSFGVVLYEMLSGRKAFSGESPVATALAIVKDEPPLVQASPSLEKIVRCCLSKQPLERYQAMSEVKAALEQVFGEKTTGASAEQQPSIAVLPFVNMSGDKEQEYFSDGLAEEIINALTQIPGLKVIAWTTAFPIKGKQEDVRKIAEALSVTNILEGSVRKAGNRIRVTAQLIDAADGSHLWSERYDREMSDVFAIQDEISQAIAKKLRVRLSGDRQLVKRHTENLEAYNLYLKGRYHLLKITPEGLAKGKEYCEQAIALDPDFALSWAGLATYHLALSTFGLMPPKEADKQCYKAAMKALELDEMLLQAHALIGVLRACEFDWKGAEREFRRALELGPGVSDVWLYYGRYYLTPMQRREEAMTALQKALELDPLSPSRHNELGYQYFLMRQYNRAIEQYRNALELDPYEWVGRVYLGLAYLLTGKVDDALLAIEAAVQLSRRNPFPLGGLGLAYAWAGRTSEAQKLLEELQQLAQKTYVPHMAFAIIYWGIKEIDRFFDWFEKAIEDCSPSAITFCPDPIFDPLRSQPRYHTLLRKMNRDRGLGSILSILAVSS